MKKTLILAVSVLYFSQAIAQTAWQANKPVMCDTLENVTSVMKDKFGEEVVWVGDDLDNHSKYVMMSNLQTKTWTFVQFTKDWACVLGTGTGASPLKLGTDA